MQSWKHPIPFKSIDYMADFFANDQLSIMPSLLYQCYLVFNLLTVGVISPISETPERSFRCLTRTETWLRSFMSQERRNSTIGRCFMDIGTSHPSWMLFCHSFERVYWIKRLSTFCFCQRVDIVVQPVSSVVVAYTVCSLTRSDFLARNKSDRLSSLSWPIVFVIVLTMTTHFYQLSYQFFISSSPFQKVFIEFTF